MGISPNEVTSLATGEYDYTDVPMSRDEMYRRDVRIPFAKGKAFYDSQNAKIAFEQMERANNRKVSVTINGVKETVTMAEAIEILGYEKAILEYEREAAQRVTSTDQKTALTPINISRATKSAGEWVADTLGGKHHTDVNGVVTYSFGKDDASARKRELAYRVTEDLNMVYTETVLDNTVGTFVEYQNLAGLDDPQKLRMFMLNAAYNMDPDTNTYVKLLTENFIPPPESQFYQGETGWGTIPDRPAFARALEIINNEQGGFKPQTRVTPEVTSEDTPKVISEDTWGNLSYEKFVTFTKDYKLAGVSGKDEDKTRAGVATKFNDNLIDDIKQFKGITESTYDDRIREYLDISNILADDDLSLYSSKEGQETKFSKIEAKVDGLEEFIDGLMPVTAEPPTVETVTAEPPTVETVTAEPPPVETVKLEDESGRSYNWSGDTTEIGGKDVEIGIGTITLKDGSTASGEMFNGDETGPWTITKAGQEPQFKYYPRKNKELDNIKTDIYVVDRHISSIRYDLNVRGKEKEYEELVKIETELRDLLDRYENGQHSTEDFMNTMKKLGSSVEEVVKEVWVDDEVHGGEFKIGGRKHTSYVKTLNDFNNSFNLNTEN